MAKEKEKMSIAKEARKVLLNQVELDSDGNFRVVNEVRFQMWGPADGEQKIRTFGVSRRDYYYTSDYNNTQAVYKVSKAISSLGRGVKLQSYDTSIGCIFKTYIFYPVCITFYENEEGLLQASFFTARSLTAFIVQKIALKRFDLSTTGIIKRHAMDNSKNNESDDKQPSTLGIIGNNIKELFGVKPKEKQKENEEDEEDDIEEDNE